MFGLKLSYFTVKEFVRNIPTTFNINFDFTFNLEEVQLKMSRISIAIKHPLLVCNSRINEYFNTDKNNSQEPQAVPIDVSIFLGQMILGVK